MSNIWNNHLSVNCKWVTSTVKRKLKDQYQQEWHSDINESESCYNYRLYKHDFGFEKYLTQMLPKWRTFLCKFRTLNHRLPVVKGRMNGTPRHERYCGLCNSNKLGDEYHFLMECPALTTIRKDIIPSNLLKHANVLKFHNLMNANTKVLNKVGKFICEGFKLYK